MADWINFLGWAILPQLATNCVQSIYYRTVYYAGANIPKPGQPRYALHRKRIFVIVVLAYLIYTIVDVIHSRKPNYYDELNISQDFTIKEIKTNLRKLQLEYHPDKNQEQGAQETFILLRVAYDTLTDPVKRFAYDRFGAEINNWNNCITLRDYLVNGWTSFFGFYIGTGLVLFILNILGKGQFGRFWRFVVFFAIACLEASMILHPNPPFITSLFLSRWVIFEQIIILRQLFITIFVALSQIGPVLFPSDEIIISPSLVSLETISKVAAIESRNFLQTSFQPFQEDIAAQKELEKKMENLVVDAVLYQNDPELTQMYSQVYQRMANRRKNQ
ncbi:21029_t:CDS:2 [Cetraspora pellucida]|uniref:21029_t:CDS:1 n=1 Tax=Cetraspora pellucida TaxID=1433469 RepID=A0A9N9GJ68_9GLOM|nr:21029_t:CDS:2 [Cetraspora pellucida]